MADNQIDLPSFFLAAATGVNSAQRLAEARRIERRSIDYTIPRATMSAEMSVRHDSVKGSIFTGRRHTTDETGFQLQFSLLATPFVPTAPPSLDASELQSIVSLPWFLVRDPERNTLARTLLTGLRTLAGVMVEIPGQASNPKPGQFNSEIGKIQDVLKNDAGSNPDDSIGLVALALDESRTSFLLVRLGKHPEGIFVLRQSPPAGITVYRHVGGSTADPFFYTPLRLAIAALRAWITQGTPGVALDPEALPAMLGPVPTGNVAHDFWVGQAKARQALHDVPTASLQPSAQLRAFYQLSDVSATLSYTVPPPAGSQIDVSLVNSQVRVTPRDQDIPAGSPARADLVLLSPDYTITGTARETLLDLIQNDPADLVKQFADSDLFPAGTEYAYTSRLQDKSVRPRAIILLSYRFETPVNQFLVIWPAALEDQEREFVFRITLANDEISTAEFFLPVEDQDTLGDPVPQPPRPIDSIQLSEASYLGFHDFFHAIRIWNLKSRGPGASQ